MNTRRDCPKLQSDFVLALPRALVSPGHHTFWILSLSVCLQIMNKAKSSCVYGDVWLQIIQCTFGRESPQIFNFYVDNLKKKHYCMCSITMFIICSIILFSPNLFYKGNFLFYSKYTMASLGCGVIFIYVSLTVQS